MCVLLASAAVLDEDDRPLVSVSPSDSLLEAVFNLSEGRVHRLLVVNPITGNALHVLTYLRILRFIYVCVRKQIFISVLIIHSFVMLHVVSVSVITAHITRMYRFCLVCVCLSGCQKPITT